MIINDAVKYWGGCIKLFVGLCVIVGLFACSSGGGGASTSTDGGTSIDGLTVSSENSIITDDEIVGSGDGNSYTFVLRFTADVSADELSVNDFTTTDTGNIKILNIFIAEGAELITDATVEFEFVDDENTEKVDITIDVGKIRNTNQTNAEPIVLSIDRAPRIILIGGNSKTEFNKSDLEGINNVISYTFNFSEAIDGLDENDFVITPANTGVSAQTVSFNDEKTEATVDFLVVGDVDDTFSITLPNGSYTDQGENGNREETTELPLNITIDTIAPSIISPVAGDYDVTTDSFTLTIDFSEALNLTDNPILTESNIVLNNATIEESTIDNNGNGGTGRVVIEAKIISLSGDRPTITINGSAYSDTLGNTGSNTYELTINSEVQEPAWLVAGECQNISFDGTGDGSDSTPYQISHICHLQNIDEDDITINGVAYTNLLDKNYILVSDIDANYTSSWNNEQGFNPIGDNTDSFDGTFDGGGFTLSNLTIDRVDDDYIGVFGYSTGTIKDIVLDNTDITGNENVGGLVGQNEGTINSSIASGSVVGNTNVGGFVGTNNNGTYSDDTWCTPVNADSSILAVGLNNGGDIDGITTYENCTIVVTANDVQNINDNLSGHYIVVNDIDLSTINNFNPIGTYNNGNTTDSFYGTFDGAGFTLSNLTINRNAIYIGVFGYNTGTIKDITLDSVDITGNQIVGGLVGRNYGIINNSSSSGSIVGQQYIGGIAGWNYGIINNSSSSVSVVSFFVISNIGGFVGNNYGTIENSSSSGSVIGIGIVGGFVGENNGIIMNSRTSGSVVGTTTNTGGFVGVHFSGSYLDNIWCKLADSSLLAIGLGSATGIATLNEDCE